MGAWVVYGSTEMGANPELSWLGVIGYSAASALPALIICVIGPRVKKISGEKAFCTTDFGLVRYGRLMQFSIAAISVFYSKFEYHHLNSANIACYLVSHPLLLIPTFDTVFIYMVSEMTSISNVYGLVVGVDTFSDDTVKYTTSIAM